MLLLLLIHILVIFKHLHGDLAGSPVVRTLPSNEGSAGLIPSQGAKREGNGNPLQYACLGNPLDGRAW